MELGHSTSKRSLQKIYQSVGIKSGVGKKESKYFSGMMIDELFNVSDRTEGSILSSSAVKRENG